MTPPDSGSVLALALICWTGVLWAYWNMLRDAEPWEQDPR